MFHSRAWPSGISDTDVAICGDGASAVALVHGLAKTATKALSVVILGRGHNPGEGVAYATPHPFHLLNVPAARMSADPDDPEQFTRWLRETGYNPAAASDAFLPRHLYGRYLAHLVSRVDATSRGRVRADVVRTEIQGLIRTERSWIIAHAHGSVRARIVVLATGTDMPTPIGQRYPAAVREKILDDPWSEFRFPRDQRVLVVGSGLTAVDTLLTLAHMGHGAQVFLISRHGHLPLPHAATSPMSSPAAPCPHSVLAVLRSLRKEVGPEPTPARWQSLMDAMRPKWPEVWKSLPTEERRRFLRHGATLWNLHRHRIAPAAHAMVQPILDSKVTILRGRLRDLAHLRSGLIAFIGSAGTIRSLAVDRVINCSGPNCDPEKTHDPFVQNILASRLARTSPAGVGLDVDGTNRVIARDGAVQRTLFAMGSLTKGHWWEITAMPEIAQQAAQIARSIQTGIASRGKAIMPLMWQLE